MNWKIVAVSAIILIIAFVMVARTPEVTGFFTKVYDYMDNSPSNITFFFATTSYDNITLNAVNSEIEIIPINIDIEVGGGKLVTENPVTLSGFQGSLKISGDTVDFQGTIKEVRTGDSSLTYTNQNIKGNSFFERLSVGNITMSVFNAVATEGTLKARTTDITVNNEEIIIMSPTASFSFNNGMSVAGKARKIELPDSGLVVD